MRRLACKREHASRLLEADNKLLRQKLNKARAQPTAELNMKHVAYVLSAGYVDSVPHTTA